MVPNEALEKKGISQFLKLIQAKSQLYERKYEAGTKSDLDESKRSHLETGPLELSGNTQNLGETAQRLKSLSASIENSCKKYLGSLDDRIISDVITKALDGPLKSYIRGEAELFFNIEETKEKKLEITGFKFENCKEIEAQKKPILDALKVDKMLELVPPTDPFHENLLTLKTKFTFNPDFTEQDFKASLFQILSEQEPNYDNIDVKAFKEARFIAAQNSKPAEPDNSAQVESGLETVTNYCKMAIRQIEETMKRNVIEAGIKGSDVEINAPLEAIKNQYSELYEKCSKLKNPNKEMVQALVSRVLNDEVFKQKIEQIEVLSQDDVFKGWHYVKYHIDNLQAMSDPEFNFKKEKDQQQRDSVAPSGIDQMIKLLEDKKS